MPYRTHKITLDPTFKQSRWFSQQCGYARFAYNQALSDFKIGLDTDNFQSWQTLNNNFNKTNQATIGQVHKISVLRYMLLKIWVKALRIGYPSVRNFRSLKGVDINKVSQQTRKLLELKARK